MNVDEVVDFFGSVQKVADFYGLTREAVYTWRKRPGSLIPKGRAAEAATFSQGKLRYNPELYPAKVKQKRGGGLNNENQA